MDTGEVEKQIESAEEEQNVAGLLDIICSCTKHGGDDNWIESAEASLDSYYRLLKGGAAAKQGSLCALFASLKAWREEEAIVEVALGCVVAITSSGNGYNVDADEHPDVSLVIEVMRSFEDETTIQEQACLSIEGLAASSDAMKEKLRNVEGIMEELVAAKDIRITNERNKSYPVRAAKALGIEL
mmetsp:Transcript_7731/g.16779  ORF Transcript_7731/g.16779 Transcript_7731/m.16779 type:complete len:185 (-) Transcript_7731:312-866(-)|eukprot:CAMPEP_0113309220 /NCGR_PEP_ID=MMETSP0010_2-20120614/7356_1 /TAXON_ID=216773 ORGANISM="Corethron hystrix, Strain 308" /NCGR_SAMPLE_ID=MMETSP0010_2 /ASSEMBLY_ACC=CAM_ASM_000155 /LENGTH=184 /DNA_ID=CAMNT_0000164439 /DNA_START=43 /DNA_END=597 /DNA_ORIENTATION=+ /assembly_acc=CAM_ASM_000155